MSLVDLVPASYRWMALAALVAACSAIGYLKGHAAGSAGVQARWDAAVVEQTRIAQQALARALDKRDKLAAELKTSSEKHLRKLHETQRETNRLRDCLASGSCGLRIRAQCPATPRLPSPSAGAGVDPGEWAVLAPAARPAYFALRDGIERTSAQLAACQGELRLRTAAPEP